MKKSKKKKRTAPPSRHTPMLTFRTANPSDIDCLRQLAGRIWRVSYAEMLSPAQIDYMLAWMYDAGRIAQEMAEGVRWELAEHEAEPAGFLSLTRESEVRMKLNKLYLLPELQGRGLGQAMIQRALELARRDGAEELWLQVNKQNHRALRAYERAGFWKEGEGVFEIGEGYVMDDYLLRCSCRE